VQKILTFKEKRFVEKLMKESRNASVESWSEWGAYFLMGLGGFVIVFVCFTTLTDLSATSIKFVLLPGTAIGMFLTFFGAYGLHAFKVAEEKKILSSLVRKLLA